MDLTGKVALVTGAGSGIGRVSAVRFAKAGAKVGVLSHTPDEVKEAAEEIRKAGGDAIHLTADVGDPAQIERAINELAAQYGRLDVVFANAGINGVWAPIEELTPADWTKTINTNLTGTFLTIKYAVPHLKRAGGGSVLVTASVNGTRIFSNTGATAYSCTKAAQLAMTQMLALELARSGIRVNCICPGSVDTEINDNTKQRDVDKVKIKVEFEQQIPLNNRPATSDEVADLALFLASDLSRHITGTPVWIDGAQSLLQG
ncbi:MAG: 3-oxoacyl-[acyl-carrier-protein] reductase [Phycisphaerales bacterium]|nr:3-oxoacyl-[acyl-carrier-protein] reductase [Phycisphaerales bacterium]